MQKFVQTLGVLEILLGGGGAEGGRWGVAFSKSRPGINNGPTAGCIPDRFCKLQKETQNFNQLGIWNPRGKLHIILE